MRPAGEMRPRHRRLMRVGAFASALALFTAACAGAAPSPQAPSPQAASPSTAATAAASPSVAEEKPLFVAINRIATAPYFVDLQSAFTAEIEKLGGTAKTYDAKQDANLSISLLNDAVSAGAKGIAITAEVDTAGPAIAKIAKDAGVALVATDVNLKDESGNPVPFVGFNGKAMGTSVGNEAMRLLQAAGWLGDSSMKVGVLSVELQSAPVCEDRTNVSKDIALAAGVPAANIYQVPYGGDTASSQDAAGPVITAHPDVTNWVIFACNDEGVLGALNALATAGAKPENIIGVGLGAYEACKAWAAGQASGFKAALFISGLDVGQAAADVLWDNVVNGKPLPEQTVAKTTMVDPATYSSVLDPVSLGNCSQ